MVTNNFNPFLVYSKKFQTLLTKAGQQKNPALWLFKNDVRTVLFMLEALTRLHSNAFDEKLFAKWNKRFKKLEDVFGEIEQYTVLENQIKSNKKISKEILKYFAVNTNNYMVKCNERLQEKDWFNNKLSSFDSKLNEFDVEYNQEYMNVLKQSIADEIETILIFAEKSDYHFTKIEGEVHELRRKLRWLSIYAQSLNGLIQLKKSTKKADFKIKYFTPEVLKSPFNKLPVKPKNTAFIEFDSNAFLALSWLINELGVLKDNALKIQKLSDAIFIVDDLTVKEANNKAIAILGLKANAQEDILKQASSIIETALAKDKILNSLVI